MIDNFDIVRDNILRFDAEGEFYMILVLRRRKDVKGNVVEGVNEDNRLIKHYFVYDAEYFEKSAIEYLCLHVCPSCPLWTKTEDYHGECGSPNWWRDCIDKLYAALVKEGKIKEDAK